MYEQKGILSKKGEEVRGSQREDAEGGRRCQKPFESPPSLDLAWGPRPASGKAIWQRISKALKIPIPISLVSPQIYHKEKLEGDQDLCEESAIPVSFITDTFRWEPSECLTMAISYLSYRTAT